MNFFQHLINFFCWRKPKRKEIPFPEIDDSELLARAILHPMYCSDSKKKLKREAFLPPQNRSDVSVLRLLYTNDDFCKQHAKSLSNEKNSYRGIATLKAEHIRKINSDDYGMTIEIKGTPIDNYNNYTSKKPVYIDDAGLPMHADIIFSEAIQKNEPNSKHRAIANALMKVALYFPDPEVNSNYWSGEKLHWIDRVGKTA